MKRFFRPLVLLLLAGMVALSPLCALAQEVAAEEEAPITHTAIASVALKVRRSPSKDASAGDSIPRDSLFISSNWARMVQSAHHPHGRLCADSVSGRHHPL